MSETANKQNDRERTTAAKRLLTLMTSLKEAKGVTLYRVLPNVMNIESAPQEVELGWPYAKGLMVIGKMIADFELEIDSSSLSDDERAFHLECKFLIASAIAPTRLQMPWDQAKVSISETLIARLQAANVALLRSVTEQMLEQKDLKKLREVIEEAMNSLNDSLLPQELKSFIAMHLIRVRTALDEYQYRGGLGLQDALAGYLGSLAVSSEKIDEHTTEPQKRKLSEVLTVANGVMTLAHSIAMAWPHLHAGFGAIAKLLPS